MDQRPKPHCRPCFIVYPGYPAPTVTWYRHGEPLGRDALVTVFTRDGYHCLAADDPGLLEGGEIVCHVENEAGFLHRVLNVSKDGN